MPEVETIRSQLAERIPGRRIERLHILDAKFSAPAPPSEVEEGVRGRTIDRVDRRGKYLLFDLDDGHQLALHLRMTGSLLWTARAPESAPRFLRAMFTLGDGAHLAFADMRRFGRAWFVPGGRAAAPAYWAGRVGVEPLDQAFTVGRLAELLAGRRGPVKATLLNQALVAGLGNIYADEALFAAGVHPLRPAGSLSGAELAALHGTIRTVLATAVAAGGASIDNYRDGLGQRGVMQDLLQVHLHRGDPCPRCGDVIVKTRVAQRGTYLCPTCQPAPC